ncbi:unnamed protein product, partial [Amoebophrya sp. A120]
EQSKSLPRHAPERAVGPFGSPPRSPGAGLCFGGWLPGLGGQPGRAPAGGRSGRSSALVWPPRACGGLVSRAACFCFAPLRSPCRPAGVSFDLQKMQRAGRWRPVAVRRGGGASLILDCPRKTARVRRQRNKAHAAPGLSSPCERSLACRARGSVPVRCCPAREGPRLLVAVLLPTQPSRLSKVRSGAAAWSLLSGTSRPRRFVHVSLRLVCPPCQISKTN